MSGTRPAGQLRWHQKEDSWAIILALGIVAAALLLFGVGRSMQAPEERGKPVPLSLKPIAVSPAAAKGEVFKTAPPAAGPAAKPAGWTAPAQLAAHFAAKWPWYLAQFALFAVLFTAAVAVMGGSVKHYLPGFLIIYLVSLLIYVFSEWDFAKAHNLEAPLVALLLGLLVGNLAPPPKWFDAALRTEFYIKTGIILLGATLPFTLIIKAGHVAFLQATIVSLSTFFVIYFVGTRVFHLDRPFCAVMGAGGSVCGVSASIAVGGAVEADKEQVAISISLVTVFAIVMIFLLPILSKALRLDPGVAGAWIGNSEFADAAGLAAAQAIGDEKAIRAFTLMKVIGRDIWIGLWSFALAFVSVVYWKKRDRAESKVSGLEIWWRFPKFVLGFFVASIVISLVSIAYLKGTLMKDVFDPGLTDPIKTLRTWTFIFTFLCIGLTTRFRSLAKFGWPPLLAFFSGVLVNAPLGYILSRYVFADFWINKIK